MGTTFFNYHVRTENVETIRQSIERIGGIAWVAAEPMNGWVSVYPYRCEADELAREANLPLIHLNLYDNDIASYELFENGVLVDKYDSAPDAWVGSYDENGDEVLPKSLEERKRLAGRPDLLLPYCQNGVTIQELSAAFGKSIREALERADAFAREHYPDRPNTLPAIDSLPGIDRPDAFSVIMELFRLLGLEERFLYSGNDRPVWEEGFPLLFVGEERLIQNDLDRLLESSIPDCRIVPHTGKVMEEHQEQKLAMLERMLTLGANPQGREVPAGLPLFRPLMMAASQNSLKAVRLLLEAGADPNASKPFSSVAGSIDFTPLLLAKQTPGTDEVIACLRAYGATG